MKNVQTVDLGSKSKKVSGEFSALHLIIIAGLGTVGLLGGFVYFMTTIS